MDEAGQRNLNLPRYAQIQIELALIIIVSSLTCLLWVRDARSGVHYCLDRQIVIVSSKDLNIGNICGTAKDAISFLEHNGLPLKSAIEINVLQKLPADAGADSLGCYDSKREKIYILTIELCSAKFKGSILFGSGSRDESYRSLIVHEVAHAIVLQNFAMNRPSWVAQEYVAYVTQIATLSPRHREYFLARVGARGFENESQMNPTILMTSPDFFAASAYRHFMTLGRGAAFLQRFLAGDAR